MSDGRWSLQKIAGDIPDQNMPLVQVSGLRKLYPLTTGLFQTSRSYIHAVDDINFTIPHGESLGLVGESGSGKTTTGKLLVRLIDPTEGQIHIYTSGGDTEIAHLRGTELKRFRRHVQMIFQDPYESLNPRRTIFDTVAEPLVVQGIGDLAEREPVTELLVAQSFPEEIEHDLGLCPTQVGEHLVQELVGNLRVRRLGEAVEVAEGIWLRRSHRDPWT